jgi:toxin ParE1/3/4
MAAKIKWSERAAYNLNHIYDYIASDSQVYANRFVRALIRSTEKQLHTHNNSGRFVPEFVDTPFDFLKEVIYRGYRIIYNPTKAPESITIIAVLNGRQDMLRNVKADWEID